MTSYFVTKGLESGNVYTLGRTHAAALRLLAQRFPSVITGKTKTGYSDVNMSVNKHMTLPELMRVEEVNSIPAESEWAADSLNGNSLLIKQTGGDIRPVKKQVTVRMDSWIQA